MPGGDICQYGDAGTAEQHKEPQPRISLYLGGYLGIERQECLG
jgi:hypothetical protein